MQVLFLSHNLLIIRGYFSFKSYYYTQYIEHRIKKNEFHAILHRDSKSFKLSYWPPPATIKHQNKKMMKNNITRNRGTVMNVRYFLFIVTLLRFPTALSMQYPKPLKNEETLCILLPKTVQDQKTISIAAALSQINLGITKKQLSTQISKANAEILYQDETHKEFKEKSIKKLIAGPVHILVWKGKGAIHKVANCLGEAAYTPKNEDQATKAINLFFPPHNGLKQ